MATEHSTLPFISIVTVNWNGRHLLEKLLPALEAQDYPTDRYEIIVVDNYSTRDDSVDFLKANYPSVKLLENHKNDGFARGCNLGMKLGRGDYFMLVNNDTQPKPDWLSKIVDCAEQEQADAVVSKLLFAKDGGKIINNAGSILYPDRSWPVEEIGANQPDGPEYSKRREITALCGASLLLSRTFLNKVGLFDESFFMYFEDTDLSWRGQKLGAKYYCCPDSVILHEHSASSKEHSDFWTFYVTRNRLLILLKHARLLLTTKAYLAFVKEFILLPIGRGLAGKERRHQLRMVRLGLKIQLSLLVQFLPALLKRWQLLHEPRLAA